MIEVILDREGRFVGLHVDGQGAIESSEAAWVHPLPMPESGWRVRRFEMPEPYPPDPIEKETGRLYRVTVRATWKGDYWALADGRTLQDTNVVDVDEAR